MSDYQKKHGAKIGLRFSKDLVGDVTGCLPTSFSTKYELPEGTASASSVYSTYAAVNAFDGSTSTYWCTRDAGTQWVKVELFTPRRIVGFRWYVGSNNRPNAFVLECSNNDETWTEIFSGESANTTGWKDYSFNLTMPYRFYRWSITSRHSSYLYIYEIELLLPIGNERAFAVTGKERQYIGGPLVDVEYPVESVERHPVETDKAIILAFPLNSRFPNVEGQLTVAYDATKGNLRGDGGAVESFETSFTPTDLRLIPRPRTEEYVAANITDFEIDVNTIMHSVVGDGPFPSASPASKGTKGRWGSSDAEHVSAQLVDYAIVLRGVDEIEP